MAYTVMDYMTTVACVVMAYLVVAKEQALYDKKNGCAVEH